MAITMEEIGVDVSSGGSVKGRKFVSKLPHDVRDRLHITVGTKDRGIQPVEAKTMFEQWKKGKDGNEIKSIKLDDLIVYRRAEGLI